MALILLPRFLTRTGPPVVKIDPEECTGCDLCVVDCPYLALELVDREEADRPLAVVDPNRCVGCGICIGSCSFGAMELPGYQSVEAINPESSPVVLACARHMTHASPEPNDDTLFVEVACTGMLHHSVVGALTEKGAASVQIIGCGPNDCTYGIGNTLTAERLDGERAPHVSRQWAGVAREDFVAPTTMDQALETPGAHPIADPKSYPSDGSALSRAGLLVIASIALVALATRAPFAGAADEAAVRIVVDHEPGRTISGSNLPSGQPGESATVEVVVDGDTTLAEIGYSGVRLVGIVDIDIDPGPHRIEAVLIEGDDRTTLYQEDLTVEGGQRVFVEVADVPLAPGVSEGRAVFNSRSGGACNVCHSIKPDEVRVGPSLAGIGSRGGERIPGLEAPGYIRQSILAPDAYIVEGFPSGQMLDIYQDRLSETDLEALVAYLSSLTEEDQRTASRIAQAWGKISSVLGASNPSTQRSPTSRPSGWST